MRIAQVSIPLGTRQSGIASHPTISSFPPRRTLFSEISKRFPTMPFSLRSLEAPNARFGLVECLNHGLLHPYPVLHEKPDQLVGCLSWTSQCRVGCLPASARKLAFIWDMQMLCHVRQWP